MVYLKHFKEVSQYNSYISGSPVLPNVSMVKEDSSMRYNPYKEPEVIVTSITVNSFSYSPSTVDATGGTATPNVSYTINYSDGTSKTTGGIITYTKNSGVAIMDTNGVLTWTSNTEFSELTTNVTVTVTKDGINSTKNANSKQSGKPVIVTAVTVNSFAYNPENVAASGGTANAIVTYTIKYNNGTTSTTGATLEYTKNSGVATIGSDGTATWAENLETNELTTNVTVTVSKDGVNGTKSADSKQAGKVGNTQVGEVLYWDGSALKTTSAWTSSLGTPLGVCVIPSSHNVYGNGKAGFISIKGVDTDGSPLDEDAYPYPWDIQWRDTTMTKYSVVPTWDNVSGGTIGSSDWGNLCSDKFTGGTQNTIDTNTYYSGTTELQGNFIPSPYMSDGSLNTAYTRTLTNNNALSDFNGKTNTSTIVSTFGETGGEAANACIRYSTNGISAGNWYLPAAGELSYIMPRLNVINAALSACGGVTITKDAYLVSTDSGDGSVYHIKINSGTIILEVKDAYHYVRPFTCF